jgi:hypothetical protein
MMQGDTHFESAAGFEPDPVIEAHKKDIEAVAELEALLEERANR